MDRTCHACAWRSCSHDGDGSGSHSPHPKSAPRRGSAIEFATLYCMYEPLRKAESLAMKHTQWSQRRGGGEGGGMDVRPGSKWEISKLKTQPTLPSKNNTPIKCLHISTVHACEPLALLRVSRWFYVPRCVCRGLSPSHWHGVNSLHQTVPIFTVAAGKRSSSTSDSSHWIIVEAGSNWWRGGGVVRRARARLRKF